MNAISYTTIVENVEQNTTEEAIVLGNELFDSGNDEFQTVKMFVRANYQTGFSTDFTAIVDTENVMSESVAGLRPTYIDPDKIVVAWSPFSTPVQVLQYSIQGLLNYPDDQKYQMSETTEKEIFIGSDDDADSIIFKMQGQNNNQNLLHKNNYE